MKSKSVFGSALAVAMACAIALPLSARASDGTIGFVGQLTGTTCSVAVNGTGANATISLPGISASQLATATQTAGATPFQMQLTQCSSGGNVQAFFEDGQSVDHSTYNLINAAAAGAAMNVQVQLYSANGAIQIGNPNQLGPTQYYQPIASGSATLSYGAQYYSLGAASAGTVSSTVTYSINYL